MENNKQLPLILICIFTFLCIPKLVLANNLKALENYKNSKDMPLMVKVSDSDQFKVYFVNKTKCNSYKSSSKTIDMSKAKRALNVVSQLEKQLLKLNDIGGEKWVESTQKHLYPIHVMISVFDGVELSTAGVRWSLTPCDEDDNKKALGGPNFLTLILGGNFNENEKEASRSILQHELGHVLHNAFGYPRWFIWNEVYADLFAMILSDWSPYMGKGSYINVYSERLSLEEYIAYLSDKIIEEKQASASKKYITFLEESLKTLSPKALRDFTIKLNYNDTFKYPSSHNLSSYLSPAFYEYSQQDHQKQLARRFLNTLINKSPKTFAIDPYYAFSKSLNIPKEFLASQGWQPSENIAPQLEPQIQTFLVEEELRNDEGDYIYSIVPNRKAFIIYIEANKKLKSINDETSVSPLISSVMSHEKVLWQGYSDIEEGENDIIRIGFLPVKECAKNHHSCQCFNSENYKLQMTSMFINKENTLQNFKTELYLRQIQGCYTVQNIGLEYDWVNY